MKKLLTIIMVGLCYQAMAQTTTITASADTSKWKKGGVATVSISQSSFSNWAAGGENNVNLTSLISVYANRKTATSSWENNLDLGYGVQKISNGPYRKSEDRIEMNSKWGTKMNDQVNYSILVNFKSQFVKGFTYTDTTEVLVSNFMAPSFTTISGGLDYRPSKDLSIFFSPITGKITTLFDDSLSAKGAFGVDTGKKIRLEVGALASIKYQRAFKNNLFLKSKLDLFANYKNFQAIDINWENVFTFQINKLLAATLTTNLIYDQDILIPKDKELSPGVFVVENAPRTQFKQVFALGITYKF